MNATELAKYLGVSLQTIYTYIKNGVIVPENLDSWQIDNQYIISAEEAERVKELLRPDGLTTKEVAEQVGCEQRHVIAAIEEGKLNAKVRDITERKQYFVQEDELLDVFKQTFQAKKKKGTKYIDPQRQLYLFQSYYHYGSGTIARVVDLDNLDEVAEDQYGTKISYQQLMNEYKVVYEYSQQRTINKPGLCVFSFLLPSHVKALTYDVIEHVISVAGINNVTLDVEDRMITFAVRPSLLKMDGFITEEVIEHLRRNNVKGTVIERKQDIYLDSNDRRMSGIVSVEVQKRIQELASQEGISMEDVVGRLLEEVINEKRIKKDEQR